MKNKLSQSHPDLQKNIFFKLNPSKIIVDAYAITTLLFLKYE